MTAGDIEGQKRAAARAAAELVEDGMRVGLGTGSTVSHLLPALAERGLADLRCVCTSPATEEQARSLGLPVEPFDSLDRLGIAIDGADQISPDNWLVKGGGGAHTREKIVAAAAERFVVIADESKRVQRIAAPVPLELAPFGIASTLARLSRLGEVEIREGAPPSPDGGVIADYQGDPGDPAAFAARMAEEPGVVEHGLFPPQLVSEVVFGPDNVEILKVVFDALNRGDFDAVTARAHPNVELVRTGQLPTLEGAAALRAWLEPDAIEEMRYEPLEFTPSGDKVLVRQKVRARGAGSGIEMEIGAWGVFTFDAGGLLIRAEAYMDYEEAAARASAGLS